MSFCTPSEGAQLTHPLVYEINTRCWLHEVSAQEGKAIHLGNVPEREFLSWKRLGFTHIWLMGVWTVGPVSRSHSVRHWKHVKEIQGSDPQVISGSPYAIQGYEVSATLGGDKGLAQFRATLNQHGLGLILDFIPNHVGLDHRWVRLKPNLFVQSPASLPGAFRQNTSSGARWLAHGRDPYFDPWLDTVQLDYRNPETHAAMLSELKRVATKCDGVRCDMAMLVLNDIFGRTWNELPLVRGTPEHLSEFWAEAIPAMKRGHPEFMFLGEVYWGLEARLQGLGFDYTYDKTLYDHLVARRPQEVQRHLLESSPEYLHASAHFLENHDEPRIASLLSLAEHQAAAALLLALPGLRLLHQGQLTGATHRVPVQFSCGIPEPAQPEIVSLYESLLNFLKDSPIGKGPCQVIRPAPAQPGNNSAENIILVQWQRETPGFELVAINLSSQASECRIRDLTHFVIGCAWQFQDRFAPEGTRGCLAEITADGLALNLPPHAARFLQFTPA